MRKGQFNDLNRVLLLYVDREKSPCWVWTGTKLKNGYGKITVNYRTLLVHRFIYEQVKGPIPAGLEVDHLCSNRLCINPDHLEAVTRLENNRRAKAKQTHCKYGHPLSGDNLFVCSRGKRECRTCRKESARRYRERRRAASTL